MGSNVEIVVNLQWKENVSKCFLIASMPSCHKEALELPSILIYLGYLLLLIWRTVTLFHLDFNNYLQLLHGMTKKQISFA